MECGDTPVRPQPRKRIFSRPSTEAPPLKRSCRSSNEESTDWLFDEVFSDIGSDEEEWLEGNLTEQLPLGIESGNTFVKFCQC